MGTGIAISVTFSGIGRLFGADLAGVVEAARIADAAGVDQVALPDHLAIGPRTDRYPYGRFPLPADEPWLEPLTALAAMAAVTRRVRLATGVLIAPLRPALLLAKTAATLDVLSRGRLDLGVGMGWQPEEFEACGVSFAERDRRLDDALRACRALWSGEPVDFAGETVRFASLRCLPRPVQRGGPPVWFGVSATPRNARRIAELGAGWTPLLPRAEALGEGLAAVRAAWTSAGRDSGALGVRVNAPPVPGPDGRPDLERTLDALPRLAEAGATVAAFPLAAYARDADAVRGVLERLGRAAAR